MTGSIVAFELDPLNYVDAGNHAATQNVYFSESLKKADRLVIIDGSLSLFMIDLAKNHVVKEQDLTLIPGLMEALEMELS